jgi:hypothetical protein
LKACQRARVNSLRSSLSQMKNYLKLIWTQALLSQI